MAIHIVQPNEGESDCKIVQASAPYASERDLLESSKNLISPEEEKQFYFSQKVANRRGVAGAVL